MGGVSHQRQARVDAALGEHQAEWIAPAPAGLAQASQTSAETALEFGREIGLRKRHHGRHQGAPFGPDQGGPVAAARTALGRSLGRIGHRQQGEGA